MIQPPYLNSYIWVPINSASYLSHNNATENTVPHGTDVNMITPNMEHFSWFMSKSTIVKNKFKQTVPSMNKSHKSYETRDKSIKCVHVIYFLLAKTTVSDVFIHSSLRIIWIMKRLIFWIMTGPGAVFYMQIVECKYSES